jgi:hypothetical protein
MIREAYGHVAEATSALAEASRDRQFA